MNIAHFHEVSANLWPERPPPVGWVRVSTIPAGVPMWDGPATSACQFWRAGTRRVFAVGPEHGSCPVGRLTMGFDAQPPAERSVIDLMTEIGYIDPVELASLATVPLGHAAIVYGPLRDLPIEPEAVLLLADAAQLMLLGEASGLARTDRPGVTLTGRPTCAAIPAALREAELRGSFACVGARVYADLGPGELLAVIPAARADAIAAGLERTAEANRKLAEVHTAAKRELAAERG
jgi:uncharacterized protein (DUF169 family)